MAVNTQREVLDVPGEVLVEIEELGRYREMLKWEGSLLFTLNIYFHLNCQIFQTYLF